MLEVGPGSEGVNILSKVELSELGFHFQLG